MPSSQNPTLRFAYKADRLKPLRAFCQTVRLGSVSRAAEALFVSQPAITLQLQALERELGERLTNAGIRGRRIRHRAIVLHLDHKRGYRTPESIAKNLAIRQEVVTKRLTWTPHGIEKRPQP